VKKRIIGVCHLLPLPGSPDARPLDRVLDRALADARALAQGGVDAVIVENYGDRPFSAGPVDSITVASMSVVAREIRRAVPIPIGINVLRNDARSALSIAHAVGAEFIRVNVLTGVYVAGEGMLSGDAASLLRLRKSLGSTVKIYADVLVKHAHPIAPTPVATLARDTAYRAKADVLVVTGAETGREPDIKTLQAVRAAVPDRPILVGSGLTPDSMDLLDEASGAIVGTYFKKGGRTESPVDVRRVKTLVRGTRGRSNLS
jgi:membrane complex biogenesis BtpA family protein